MKKIKRKLLIGASALMFVGSMLVPSTSVKATQNQYGEGRCGFTFSFCCKRSYGYWHCAVCSGC